MNKKKQQELMKDIAKMGTRQLEALKRSISISDANSFVKDRLMRVVEEREGRLNRINNAVVEMGELKEGEL